MTTGIRLGAISQMNEEPLLGKSERGWCDGIGQMQ